MSKEEKIAWVRYCEDTRGSMHCADFWWELPLDVQTHYLEVTK